MYTTMFYLQNDSLITPIKTVKHSVPTVSFRKKTKHILILFIPEKYKTIKKGNKIYLAIDVSV